MEPRDLDLDGLQQLLSSMTAEEHAMMEKETRAIAGRYADLPIESAGPLRQRDLSALVMQAIARVLGGNHESAVGSAPGHLGLRLTPTRLQLSFDGGTR